VLSGLYFQEGIRNVETDSNQAGSVANWVTYVCDRRHGYLAT
jgi:hypothetical protein